MCGSNHPDAAWQRELDRLRSVYLHAMARTDARATDDLFVRSRRSLGLLLVLLGGLPDGAVPDPTSEPDPDA